jgi:hypothetical protein
MRKEMLQVREAFLEIICIVQNGLSVFDDVRMMQFNTQQSMMIQEMRNTSIQMMNNMQHICMSDITRQFYEKEQQQQEQQQQQQQYLNLLSTIPVLQYPPIHLSQQKSIFDTVWKQLEDYSLLISQCFTVVFSKYSIENHSLILQLVTIFNDEKTILDNYCNLLNSLQYHLRIDYLPSFSQIISQQLSPYDFNMKYYHEYLKLLDPYQEITETTSASSNSVTFQQKLYQLLPSSYTLDRKIEINTHRELALWIKSFGYYGSLNDHNLLVYYSYNNTVKQFPELIVTRLDYPRRLIKSCRKIYQLLCYYYSC